MTNTNSSRLRLCGAWLIVALEVALLARGCSKYLVSLGAALHEDPDRPVAVVIKNDSRLPIQDAHLWLKDGIRDVPVIPPGHSVSLTIHPPGESNLELEFSRAKDDWRHCQFYGYAESATFPIRIDDDGTCIETGGKYPVATLTRQSTSPIVPPGSTSRPPWSDRQDQIRISGLYKAVNLEHAPAKGPATATVTVVERFDFADRECAQSAHIAQQLLAAYPRQLRVVFKHHPTSKESWEAHEAAVAAGDQGKFWLMHDLLFADQGKLTRDDLIARGRQLKLNLPRFEKDLDSHRFRPVVESDRKELPAPELFIGPYCFIQGAKDLADYKRVTDFVLKEAAASTLTLQ